MKKDETRYTIRFNPVDPRHRKAMETLNVAGRRKATLIADAVCEYVSRYTGAETASVLSATPALPTPFYTANNEFNTNDVQSQSTEARSISTSNEQGYLNDSVIDDDMRDAILGGLSAFAS